MPKVKKIPQRQCVGCREMKDKKALLRVVKAPDGTVSLDFGGKKPGRGASGSVKKLLTFAAKLDKELDEPSSPCAGSMIYTTS